jgi:hypothetical protein
MPPAVKGKIGITNSKNRFVKNRKKHTTSCFFKEKKHWIPYREPSNCFFSPLFFPLLIGSENSNPPHQTKPNEMVWFGLVN